MYIVKNALRNIARSKTRNILIGVIVLAVAISSCVGLSIREAADKAREEALQTLQITASIGQDRQALLEKLRSGETPDAEDRKNLFQDQESLTLSELQTYAQAESVKSFYYTLTSSLDAGKNLEPVDTAGTFTRDEDSTSSAGSSAAQEKGGMEQQRGGPGGFGGGIMGQQGDFTLVGYSSDEAMTAFVDGSCSVTDGTMFEEGTARSDCIISNELAAYNELAVGDTIQLVNPNNSQETLSLTVVGLYENSQSGITESGRMGGFSTAGDAANQIYLSYTALQAFVEASEKTAQAAAASADSDTDSTAIRGQLAGTYTFADMDAYESFEPEVRAMGLDDGYTVTSADLQQFEQSLQPLENLKSFALWFLLVVLAIGAVVLVVLNLFNIRERKYEVGVLTAIGMNKTRVAAQFVLELLTVSFAAIVIGAGVGAAVSVPVSNALLQSQIEKQTESLQSMDNRFGREANMSPPQGSAMPDEAAGSAEPPSDWGGDEGGMFRSMAAGAASYIDEVAYATDGWVILELVGIGLLLTLVSSISAILVIMRYEPLKILANRE